MKTKRPKKIESFDFEPGRILAGKYEVIQKLGSGWEAEVYLLRELLTGIERAAKFFFPQRNVNNRTLTRYAKKLHKLRHCYTVIHYHTQDSITFLGQKVYFLVSEYVEGEPLKDFLKRQPGGRLHAFQAVHLLYSLAKGIAAIHRLREYHGDLHPENITVHRFGLGFELKLLDMYHWDECSRPENIHDDVADMIKIFYDALGGRRQYAKQPEVVKNICCGLKKSLILKKYRTAGQLQEYLKKLNWD